MRRAEMRGGRGIALIVLLAAGLAAGWLAVELRVPYRGYLTPGVFVEISRGTSTHGIAALLTEHGVVRNHVAFELLCRWRRRQALQAGEYYFSHPMTALEVYQTLAEGKVYVHTITVAEGLTMFDVADLMEKEGVCRREEFLRAAGDPSPILDLAPRARNLEGFLFPATYQFPRHVSAEAVAHTMVRRFREVWDSFPQQGRNPSGFSPAEVVVMASLVERETGVPDERPVIAGVFYNRLRRGVALQCDPTVIYALRLADRYEGALHKEDLQIDSPYNTYRYLGLPPGPVANPGAASLRAALYPPYVDYLYFVSNTQGGHFFSKTLEEHNGNVARYRRLLAQIAQEQSQNSAGKFRATPLRTVGPKADKPPRTPR